MQTCFHGTKALALARDTMWSSVVCCLLAGCGSNEPASEAPTAAIGASKPAATENKQHAVSLRQGRLLVRGEPVNLPGILEGWEAALGPAARQEKLAATETEPFVNVYIWDQAGIVAVERPDLAQITKVSFVFVPEKAKAANAADAQLLPAAAFSGGLSIDGVEFDATTTPAKLNDKLAEQFGGAKFTQLKTFPHSWNIAYGAWTITAITDAKGEQLVEVAIGE